MALGLRARDGMWHYRIVVNGHEYSGNTGLAATKPNQIAALKVRSQVEEKIRSGKVSELRLETKPFNKAWAQFIDWARGEHRAHPSTAVRVETSGASLTTFFQGYSVPQITPGEIENFKTWRRTEHQVREVTLRHDLHALSKFFKYAKTQNWVSGNPVREVSIPSDADAVRMHIITEEEERIYFEAAARFPALYDVARLMILHGVRPDEAMSVRAADVQGGVWTISKSKTRKGLRRLPLTVEALGILTARQMTAGPSGWLFPGKKKGTRLSKLNGSHNKIRAATGLDFVLYDFRHTWATRMARVCPITTLAALLGHKDLRVLMKYVHPQPSDAIAAVRAFEAANQVVKFGFGKQQ